MTDSAVQSLEFTSSRFAGWTRIVAVVFAVVALLALSFALGGMTMGSSGHSTTIVRPAVVQPVSPPAGNAPPECRLHGPC